MASPDGKSLLTKKWTVTTESMRNLMKNVPGPHDEAIYGSMVRDFIDWVERVLPDDSQVEPSENPCRVVLQRMLDSPQMNAATMRQLARATLDGIALGDWGVPDEPTVEEALASLPNRFSLRYQFDERRWNWSNGDVGGSGTLAECIAAMHAQNRPPEPKPEPVTGTEDLQAKPECKCPYFTREDGSRHYLHSCGLRMWRLSVSKSNNEVSAHDEDGTCLFAFHYSSYHGRYHSGDLTNCAECNAVNRGDNRG